jgi:GNAT superfamily N-acetyltransferase
MSFMTLLDEPPIAGLGAAPAMRIRPYESADGELVEAMSARLSKQSLYERFFAGTPTLPPRYLAALARTDHYDREVLLAVTGTARTGTAVTGGAVTGTASGGDEVVGIAEYVRAKDEPGRADLAVLVADDWHRRGIGRGLVTVLAGLAAGRGIVCFGADALTNNRAALAAIAGLWPGARAERDGATASFTLPVRALLRDGRHDPFRDGRHATPRPRKP